ncbi:hypothetical protein [Methylobacterium nodulans]|uniref:Putative transcriptional regulator, CopG family n=1 Tax=Methylobacterium nodulans (strain LMG 21967 / CNCM I-2342 / ORS 2060) TaxID=460265 RepID=B8IMP4_METNO|nr:hypothetical protein [Methylobacterium nodulans]ACL60237.1 putative transcriptional regulator, CopG family [Methylobacterium nodulans ORS 2060]
MASRILAISLPEEMYREVDRAIASYNAATYTATTRSGYIRLAIADRIRRDADRVKRYKEANLATQFQADAADPT